MVFTRAELFELVWTQPRSTLAARIGVSDVAIAKACRRAEIPMPARGNWARLAAGKEIARPPLPLRLPGQSEMVAIGEAQGSRAASAHVPAVAPTFAVDIESLVDAALKRLGHVAAPRENSASQRGIARLLQKEAHRREQFSRHPWDFYAPKHDDASSQRQLRLFGALLIGFSRIGIDGTVSEVSHWRQGVGTEYFLSACWNSGSAAVNVRFMASPPSATQQTLLVDGDSETTTHSVWRDTTNLRLERQLDAVARAILQRAELRMRESAQRMFEWHVRENERRLREQEEARWRAEAQQLRELQQRQERQRESVHNATERFRRSADIRSFVDALEAAHPSLAHDDNFTNWCALARAEADRIDPVLGDWRLLMASDAAEPLVARAKP